MQQRRGTATQWTSADPILAAGEIGFETDTNQFKIGDGVNNWSDLSYFKNLEDLGGSLDDYVPVTTKGQVNGVAELDSTGNVPLSQLGNLIDGAPEALNTLNEIAASINDDTNFVAYVTAQLGNKANLISPSLLGAPLAPTATLTDNSTKIATTAFVKGQAYGLAVDISNLDTRMDAAEGDVTALETTTSGLTSDMTTAQNDIDSLTTTTSTHTSSISTIGGQITTLQSDLDAAELDIDNLESSVTAVEASVSTLETLTTGHTASIGTIESDITAAQTDITAIQSDLTAAEGSIATLQGDLDTAEATLSTTTSNFNAHDAKTTTVHGIADTAALATKTYADTAGTNAIASANTYADSAVASKAPLASPALTGTPTAPTATVGTNTTQIATTAFVKAEVDAVIAAAPGALNTLDELAAALGDDANYATTVTNALALKAPLAGPTFTGTVALPAASSVTLDGTALSTTLATKADNNSVINVMSGAHTIVVADVNNIREMSGGGTITIPADNSFWPVGAVVDVLQTGSSQVTVAAGSGVTVNATPGLKIRAQWSSATILKRAANTFVVMGDLSA